MNPMVKLIFSLLFLIFAVMVPVTPVRATEGVVINEFASNSDPEWVELYSTSSQLVDLESWQIIDGNSLTTDDLQLSGCINAGGFRSFSRSAGWLNNSGGDTITLKNSSDQAIDQVIYGEGGVVDIPANDKSAGRNPDGGENWMIFDTPSQRNDICQILPTLTPTPTPTPTLTPTLTPTPIPIPPTPTLTPTPTPKSDPCSWACKRAYFFQERFLRILFSALPFKRFWW